MNTSLFQNKNFRWLLCFLIATIITMLFLQEPIHIIAFWVITAMGVAIMAMEMLPMVAMGLLLPVAYIITGASSAPIAFRPWVGVVPWIILAGLIIARIMEKTGLSRRIALYIISIVGTSPLMIMIALALTGYVLGLLIPDAFTVVVLTVTLTTALCERLGIEKKSIEAGILMFAGFFAGMVPQTMYYPNNLGIIAAEMVTSTGLTFTWLNFLYNNLPTTFLMSIASIAILVPFCSKNFEEKVKMAAPISRTDLQEMGVMTRTEKLALCLIVVALFAFISEPWHGISGTFAFLFVILLGFTPLIPVLDEDDLKEIPYGILFFCTGCMAIGFVAADLGIAQWIGEMITPFLQQVESQTSLSLFAYFAGFIVNFILTPLAAVTSLSLPLMEITQELGFTLKPILYSFLYGLEQILLPYEAAPILFMYATGYVSLRFFILVMAIRFLLGAIVIAISSLAIWPFMGI